MINRFFGLFVVCLPSCQVAFHLRKWWKMPLIKPIWIPSFIYCFLKQFHKWWWLVDMMSARSVFHSEIWHFNFSGSRTSVLPSLAISPLTVVLLQAAIFEWKTDLADNMSTNHHHLCCQPFRLTTIMYYHNSLERRSHPTHPQSTFFSSFLGWVWHSISH